MSDRMLEGRFALDMQGMQDLQRLGRQDPQAGLRAAAEQFEAIFVQMMLKSMREATPRSDLFDSSQTRFYESLMDQQWAQHMAGRGVGLADQLVEQLEGRLQQAMPEDTRAHSGGDVAARIEAQRGLSGDAD